MLAATTQGTPGKKKAISRKNSLALASDSGSAESTTKMIPSAPSLRILRIVLNLSSPGVPKRKTLIPLMFAIP